MNNNAGEWPFYEDDDDAALAAWYQHEEELQQQLLETRKWQHPLGTIKPSSFQLANSPKMNFSTPGSPIETTPTESWLPLKS